MRWLIRRFCWLPLALAWSVSETIPPVSESSTSPPSARSSVAVLPLHKQTSDQTIPPQREEETLSLGVRLAVASAQVSPKEVTSPSDLPLVPPPSVVTEASTWDSGVVIESPINQTITDWESPFGQTGGTYILQQLSSTPKSVIVKSRLSLLNRMRHKGDAEPLTRRNVTTQVGQTVYLRCLVDGFESSSVSWIRLRDFHLLTVKLFTYTSDERFTPVHLQHSRDWALQIKYPQKMDEGYYECQVNGSPITSHYVFLKVLEPKAKILGAPDIFVEAGSALNLTCVIDYSPEPPVFVFWYHGDRMINYDSSKGEITIKKSTGDSAICRLFLQDAQVQDSGNYTCCPSNADATSINVHVLKGEKQAAVQNDVRPLTNSGSRQTAQSQCQSRFLILAFLAALTAATLR